MEFIKKHYKKVLFLIGYAILGYYMLKYTFDYFEELHSFNSKGFTLFVLCGIALIVLTMIILIKFNRGNIAKQFVVIALIWGTAFAVINPPFLVPDEIVHINRSYDLAKGRIFYKAHEDHMMLPFGLYKYDQNIWNSVDRDGISKYLDIANTPLEKDRLIKYNASSTGAYNFIAYVPQSIGTFIGDLLNLPTYFVLVLGRLTNLAVWILLGYLALKYMPIRKDLLFLIMFLPVGVQQAASYSPDALLNSASFLVIAYILHLKFEKEEVDYKDLLKVIGLTVLIGSIKLPYILIAGTLILIPNKKIKFGVFGKFIALILILLVNFAVMFGWQTLSKPKTQNQQITTTQSNDSSKESDKVNWVNEIVTQPNLFIEKVSETLENAEEFYSKSFTAFLGWFKVQPTKEFSVLMLNVLLLFAVLGDEKKYLLGVFDRILYLLMTVGMYLLLCAVAFQWANKPLSEIVIFDGIQGRYFYPFIIGIYMVLQNNILKIKNSDIWINTYRNLYVCWTLMFSSAMIINCYFIYNY